MARPRNFDEGVVLAQAADVFGRLGFNAASIDDLVVATGLQRGSLYKAFGSKQMLFQIALAGALAPGWSGRPAAIDLLIIALKELVPGDGATTALCRAALAESGDNTASILGKRLLEHLNDKGN